MHVHLQGISRSGTGCTQSTEYLQTQAGSRSSTGCTGYSYKRVAGLVKAEQSTTTEYTVHCTEYIHRGLAGLVQAAHGA